MRHLSDLLSICQTFLPKVVTETRILFHHIRPYNPWGLKHNVWNEQSQKKSKMKKKHGNEWWQHINFIHDPKAHLHELAKQKQKLEVDWVLNKIETIKYTKDQWKEELILWKEKQNWCVIGQTTRNYYKELRANILENKKARSIRYKSYQNWDIRKQKI